MVGLNVLVLKFKTCRILGCGCRAAWNIGIREAFYDISCNGYRALVGIKDGYSTSLAVVENNE